MSVVNEGDAVTMSDEAVGYLVIVDVIENESGGATYSFDLDKRTQKVVAELGLRLTLTCAAYGLDIEDALQAIVDRGEYLSQEETE
jgi:hypothetical protein